MKRIAWLMLLLLAVSLLLGGCGGNSDPLAIREFIIGDSVGTVEKRGSGADAEKVSKTAKTAARTQKTAAANSITSISKHQIKSQYMEI